MLFIQICMHTSFKEPQHRHEYIDIVMKYSTRNAYLQYKVDPLYHLYFLSLMSNINSRWYAPVGAMTSLTKNSANVRDPPLGESPARVPSNLKKGDQYI